MSIEYTFPCDIQVSDSLIREAIVWQCGLTEKRREEIGLGRSPQMAEEEHGEMTVFQGSGLICYFHPESSLGQSLIQEAFGFRPTRIVTFRIDKFELYEDGILNMLCTCSVIIRRFSGDCVLLENGDIPLLLRRKGHLLLQSRDPYWTSKLELIAREIGEPYIFKPMPVV